MGFRLNNIKRKVIEYGSQEAFNYMQEEINNLLLDLCPDMYYDSEDPPWFYSFSIDKEELKQAIKTLLETPDILISKDPKNYTYEDLADFLQKSLDECENEYEVFFEWF